MIDSLLHYFLSVGFYFLMVIPWWIYCGLIVLFALKIYIGNPKHFRKIRAARKNLTTFRSITNPAQQFAYIRKIDPFVFEEMILTALKDAGFKIKRNKRYTGDGGIDGRVFIDGSITLIQAKRYSAHICAQHITDFEKICGHSHCNGLFIHTGRTGKQAKINSQQGTVAIVIGQRMLDLLAGEFCITFEK